MLGNQQTVDQRQASDTRVAPRRVSTSGGSSSPILEQIEMAAESPRREAIPPLRGYRRDRAGDDRG